MKKTKVLFLAPHLSTGGMPSFLLKRLKLLKKYAQSIDPYVVEYSVYSNDFVVQRNEIIKTLPDDRFFSLGWFGEMEKKYDLLNIIRDNKIDIVHIDEMIEGFDSYNKVPLDIMEKLYSSDRQWRIIETCHNIWFDPKTMKKYHPDGYAFCTPYHKAHTFSDMPSIKSVIEFPVVEVPNSDDEKLSAMEKIGFDKNKKHVLNVGLWTSGKNQGEGIEIAKLVEKNNPHIHFHFVGNMADNFKSYWEPIVKNIPKNVTLWGERNDVDVFMTACDVFMFNSTWECNPLSIREAISHRMGILSRNLPQYMDMFTDYIVDIDNNIEKSVEKLLSIIDKKPTYNIPTDMDFLFAKKHVDLYEEVLGLPITNKNINEITDKGIKINVDFVDGPFLEIEGNSDKKYKVQFYDKTGKLHYTNTINCNNWVRLNRKYYTDWNYKVWEGDTLILDEWLNLEGKIVQISLDSKSIGDTIAWFPYCEEFRKKHKCILYVSTFWNSFFEKSYKDIKFIKPGLHPPNIYAFYKIGWYYNESMEPTLPNTIPLQKASSNILGLDYKEIKPNIDYKFTEKSPYPKKYITIATNSTAGCKFWTKEGWGGLVEYLTNLGYIIVNVSKENNPIKGVEKIKDDSIENTMNVIHHSEFFIGLSSGLSWLAWGIGKKSVMISNFTEADHEFSSNCIRVVKHDVCYGCWNNPNFKFDRGDWDWCPVHKGTKRHFECHKSITSEYVIDKIKNDKYLDKGQ